MPHDPQRYFRQIQAARAVGLRMTEETLGAFQDLLAAYAERLSRELTRPIRTAAQSRATLAIVDGILDELAVDMARVTRSAMELTVREVAEIHARATAQLLSAEGIAGLQLSGNAISTRTLQAVLTRPELAESFVTIRPRSRRAVNRILQNALLEGVSGPPLAMQVRTHILGADALPEHLLLDRRRIGYAAIEAMGLEPTPANLRMIRQEAGVLANKADLIARSEPMNAQHEARLVAAEESPVLALLRWVLSGAHPKRDFCDSLAERDMYGLGPGLYDPRRCPPRPHPRCFCLTVDVLRPVEEWGAPRGRLPDQQVSIQTLAREEKLSPSATRQIAAVMRTANTRTRRRRAA